MTDNRFLITDSENDAIENFKKSCEMVYKGMEKDPNELTFSYHFTPNGIGVIVEVYCPQLNSKYDVSDYGSW